MDKRKNQSKRVEILNLAAHLTSGDRQKQYGDLRLNHENIARLWSAFLFNLDQSGADVFNLHPANVAQMMVLLKLARELSGDFNEDDYVDSAAYAAIAGELASD